MRLTEIVRIQGKDVAKVVLIYNFISPIINTERSGTGRNKCPSINWCMVSVAPLSGVKVLMQHSREQLHSNSQVLNVEIMIAKLHPF